MISNDCASIIQTEDRVTIVLSDKYRLRGLKLTDFEESCLLYVFTMLIEKKCEVE